MNIIVFLFELLFVFSGDMFFHIVVAIIQKLIFLEPTQAQGGKKRSVHERLGRFLFLKWYSCGAKLLHSFESLELAHQS